MPTLPRAHYAGEALAPSTPPSHAQYKQLDDALSHSPLPGAYDPRCPCFLPGSQTSLWMLSQWMWVPEMSNRYLWGPVEFSEEDEAGKVKVLQRLMHKIDKTTASQGLRWRTQRPGPMGRG